MSDSPQDEPRERRRRGPLGDHEEEQTRPADGNSEAEDSSATRLIPGGSTRRGGGGDERTRAIPEDESGRTRKASVIRPSGYNREGDRPRESSSGYYEAAEERELRLQELYGGVDWLASFLGFIFAAVAGSVLSAIAVIVVGRLGLPLSFSGGALGTSAVTALVVLGVLVFLTFFCGGYVAGRLARFDGGRNGVMVVVWAVVVAAISLSVGPLLPGQIFSLPAELRPEHPPAGPRHPDGHGRPRYRHPGRGGPANAPRRLRRWTPRRPLPQRDRPDYIRPGYRQ